MARTPVVSRTLTSTIVKALCLDIAGQKVEEVDFVLPRTYKDEHIILRKLQKLYNTDEYKVEHVLSRTEDTHRYFMTEEEFISHAKIAD